MGKGKILDVEIVLSFVLLLILHYFLFQSFPFFFILVSILIFKFDYCKKKILLFSSIVQIFLFLHVYTYHACILSCWISKGRIHSLRKIPRPTWRTNSPYYITRSRSVNRKVDRSMASPRNLSPLSCLLLVNIRRKESMKSNEMYLCMDLEFLFSFIKYKK